MARKKWDGRIPYNKDGKPVVYPGWNDVEWRDNDPFEDTLTFSGFARGRSAARAVFKSKAMGCHVEMFLTTLADVMSSMSEGKVTGRWQFEKRGKNFGIRPAKEG